MKKSILACVLTALACVNALADIAPEPGKSPNRVKKPPTVNTDIDIRLDPLATEAKLIIPASQLKQLRAELENLDLDNNTAAMAGTNTTLPTQTIICGLLLSLAIVFGGLWLAKNRNIAIRSKTVGAVALLTAMGSAATLVYANAGPPAEARSITGKMFAQSVHIYGHGWGKIKLETGDGNRVQLIVPNPKEPKPAGEE